MTNAQDWLNSKFTTTEIPLVKTLGINYPYPNCNEGGKADHNQWFFYAELAGELDLRQFTNLQTLTINGGDWHHPQPLTALKLANCQSLRQLEIRNTTLSSLDLSSLTNLATLTITDNRQLSELDLSGNPNLRTINKGVETKLYTVLDQWKAEVERLKVKVRELESQPTTSTSDPHETLTTKLTRKRQELTNLQTSGRGSTAPLRKEIQLLEKLHTFESQITQQQTRETNYQSQIQQKEQELQSKQQEINRLTSLTNTDLTNTLNDLTAQLRQAGEEKTQLTAAVQTKEQALQTANNRNTQLEQSNTQKQTQISQLTQQLSNLRSEKQQLEQRMLNERQTALAQWTQEKANLETQISTLTSEKNTSRQAADYLRTTLSTTESNKADLARQLATAQQQITQKEQERQQALQASQEQLNSKQEAYILIQQRNSDLTNKLSAASQENSKLTEWIERLEAASGQGNAFEGLQGELADSKQRITELEEKLSSKQPRNNYWWILVIVGLVVLWLLMR